MCVCVFVVLVVAGHAAFVCTLKLFFSVYLMGQITLGLYKAIAGGSKEAAAGGRNHKGNKKQ